MAENKKTANKGDAFAVRGFILQNPQVRDLVKRYYKDKKENYPAIAMKRWERGTHYPPLDLLVAISVEAQTNLSYVLGLTTVNAPLEHPDSPKERTLDELLEKHRVDEEELLKTFRPNQIDSFREGFSTSKLKYLLKLSGFLGLSIDYILGYTDWESWAVWKKVNMPFSGFKNGAGVFIVADKDAHTQETIANALEREDGKYGLISDDGAFVIFPNGTKISVDDDIFTGFYITRTKPEDL